METRDIVISKEYLETIRRFTAIRPQEVFEYVPLAFRVLPENQHPIFILRPISGEDNLRFADSMRGIVTVEEGQSKAQVSIKRGEYTINVVRAGLVGWRNYFDLEGHPVDYSKGSIDALPVALLDELCEIIVSRASLTLEEIRGLK